MAPRQPPCATATVTLPSSPATSSGPTSEPAASAQLTSSGSTVEEFRGQLEKCRKVETGRREWPPGFLARKTAPKSAEALICEAVATGQHFLYEAIEQTQHAPHPSRYPEQPSPAGTLGSGVASIATKASTLKAATIAAGC